MRLPQLPPPALARLAAAALTSVSLVCAPGALLALDPAPPTTLAPLPPAASPIYEEVAALVDKYYLDRTFNGVDFKGAREVVGSRSMSESEALAEATSLVKSLGDKYSRVLTPSQAPPYPTLPHPAPPYPTQTPPKPHRTPTLPHRNPTQTPPKPRPNPTQTPPYPTLPHPTPPTPSQAYKLNKYDVTGVGINLIINDAGSMLVGAVPPEGSDASRAGVRYGDLVLEINQVLFDESMLLRSGSIISF